MNIILMRQVGLLSLVLYTAASTGGTNPITVTFESGKTSFTQGGSGTANYVVGIDKDVVPKGYPLTMHANNLPSWVTQLTGIISQCTTATTTCSSPMSLSAGGKCCLMLHLNGSQLKSGNYALAPGVATNPATYQGRAASKNVSVTSASQTTTLTISKSMLALSVKNPTINAALTGNPRALTITNTGSQTAVGLSISYPTWPGGTPATTAASTCGSTLSVGASCTITITPGQNATAGAGNAACSTGIAPTPGVITISANNATSVQSNVVVLSYGCIEQAGYIYSIDDTTATTGSITGKVIQETDNAGAPSGIVWDSSSGCTTFPFNNCYTTNADSASNGTNLSTPVPGGNTYLIYQTLTTTNFEPAIS